MKETSLEAGQVLDLEPEQLVAGGDSLARVDGLPVFIPSLYPGDRARVEIIEVKKGFARGRVVEITREGASRRAAPCPVARECGGCDWTELRLDQQLLWKRRILTDTLRRTGKFDPAALPPIRVHASPLQYRLRSRLQVEDGEAGFFAARSNRVVPLPPECEVVGPEVIRNLAEIRAIASELGAGEVATFETAGELHLMPSQRDEQAARPPLRVNTGGHWFELSAASFFQVNRHLLATLSSLIVEIAARSNRRRIAWDLYGGVGFFAAPLSRTFERVLSVEASEESHRWAARNLAGSGAAAVHAEVRRFVEREPDDPDFILIDPPRAGMAPEVVEGIGQRSAEIVCYLSCDPVTFSRDAFRLARLGWNFSSLALIDLFPNTHHIETLSSFVRER